MSRTKNLVTAEWLIENIELQNLKIGDATYFLSTHNRDAEAEYFNEHIQNAIRFDIDAIKDPNSDLPHMIPSPDQFETHMRQLGFQNNDLIVVYDNSPFLSAARAWWLLRMFGHERVFVLDGGLNRYKTLGGQTEQGEGRKTQKSNFKALKPIDTDVIKFDQLYEKVFGTEHVQILDARSSARFVGKEPEPRVGLRSGHIPKSCNVPLTSFLNTKTGEIVSDTEIKNILADAGIRLDEPIITTCGSGVTATGIALALSLIGVTGTIVYDGSWAEWGGSSAPIETVQK